MERKVRTTVRITDIGKSMRREVMDGLALGRKRRKDSGGSRCIVR